MELTALPQIPYLVSRGPLHGRRGIEEGREGLGEGGKTGGGERGNEEGRGKGGVGGIVPWLLG